MHFPSLFAFLGVAWLASAAPAPAPLNINLGAYSPALVVGDGAISFAGAEGAAAEGAAAGAAEAVAAAPAVEGAQVAEGQQTVNGVVSPDQNTAATGEAVTAQEQTPATIQDTTLLQGMGKQRLPKE